MNSDLMLGCVVFFLTALFFAAQWFWMREKYKWLLQSSCRFDKVVYLNRNDYDDQYSLAVAILDYKNETILNGRICKCVLDDAVECMAGRGEFAEGWQNDF